MAHHKRKKPRSRGIGRGSLGGSKGEAPSWWNLLMNNRPKRRDNNRLCHDIERGDDPDEKVFPLGNVKPHVYYW